MTTIHHDENKDSNDKGDNNDGNTAMTNELQQPELKR